MGEDLISQVATLYFFMFNKKMTKHKTKSKIQTQESQMLVLLDKLEEEHLF